MERAALYIRVSTDDQIEYSPHAQRKQLLEYAKKNNYIIDYNYIFSDEGISGRKAEKRPEFMHMIGIAKTKPKPFDVILVHRFDRFARNREDSVVYKSLLKKECGIKVISITEQLEDDKFSIILEAMLEAMAEYYSLNLADEVKKGMFEKANRGEHSGTLPLGYKLSDKKLILDDYYSTIVKEIFNLFVKKNYSLLEISRYLNTKNIRTKNNTMFTTRGLKYVIQNPCYYGAHRYNYRQGSKSIINNNEDWIIIENSHEPIVSKELWENAQEKIYLHKLTSSSPKKQAKKYWLSGLLRCKHCDGSMSSTITKNKYISYYCCNRKNGICEIPNNISLRKLEKIVIETMENDLKNNTINAERINDKYQEEQDIFNSKLKSIQRKYVLANNAYLTEIDTLQEYKKKKTLIRNEEKQILEHIDKITRKNDPNFDTIKFKNNIKLLNSTELSQLEKNKIVKTFVNKIVISSRDKYIKIYYYFMG